MRKKISLPVIGLLGLALVAHTSSSFAMEAERVDQSPMPQIMGLVVGIFSKSQPDQEKFQGQGKEKTVQPFFANLEETILAQRAELAELAKEIAAAEAKAKKA